MSGGEAQVAVLGMRGQMLPGRVREGVARPEWIRLAAFAALGLYGAARWSTLLAGGTHGRVVGLLGLALALAGLRPVVARWNRLVAAAMTALILVAAFPVAGVPLQWVLHLRIAVIANTVGDGLSALPQVLVPYTGINESVRLVIVLGAGVLLFDAALLLAFAPRDMEDLRRAGAALPMIALVAVPSTLDHPRYPYLDGLVLFLLLACFVLGDRVSARHAASAVGLCLVTAIVAMLVAPALDRHKPWLDYQALAGNLAPKTLDTFDWSQTYGPINWPRRGRTVLEVKAARPDYWKAEDLDVFDGRAWTQGIVPGQENSPSLSHRALRRWSQTIQVTLQDMKTSDVIGAGTSSHPAHVSQPVVAGFSAGTWTTGTALAPGDSYTVKVYAPQPSARQLQAAGTNYAGLSEGYRTILLPAQAVPGAAASAQIVFPVFHAASAVQNVIGLPVASGASIVEASAYGDAYRLAQRLARQAATPYAFALSVERLLAHGYAYNQNPPVRPYPLESFLFADRRGYCQQFAGAMALLMRMGGVPARVAVGFTPGVRDAAHRWAVTDLDAHAWVEVWFPKIGWVKFDPTPPVDPALSGITSVASGVAVGTSSRATRSAKRPNRAASLSSHVTGTTPGARHSRGGGGEAAVIAGAIALVALLLIGMAVTRPLGSTEALVAELERALERSGRPLAGGATLAQLERRMHASADATAYVRALRLARFGGRQATPTRAQRRAVRRQLAFGHGPLGRLRALWALPPRRRSRGGERRLPIRAAPLPGA
jgi:hypothetical protein